MAGRKKSRKLEEIIPLLSDDAMKVAGGMIEDAKFMEAQLKALRRRIKKEGVDESYQYGSKQTAAMTSYLQIQKQYGVIIKYLTDLVETERKKVATDDELMEFLKRDRV